MWEKDYLVASCVAQPGIQLTTQACALTQNRTDGPSVHRLALNHWATPARALILILEKKTFSFLPLSMMGFVIYSFFYTDESSHTHFVVGFYHEWISILSSDFRVSIDMVIWFLSLYLLMWCIMLIDLRVWNHPCFLVINPSLSWCIILLMYCWIQFVNILLRIFITIFIRDIDQ